MWRGVLVIAGFAMMLWGAIGPSTILRFVFQQRDISAIFSASATRWGLVAVGLAIIIGANWHWVTQWLSGWIPMWSLQRDDHLPIRRLIPLGDAARTAYRTLQNTAYSAAAEHFSDGEPDGIETYFAILLVEGGRMRLYGVSSTIGTCQLIPADRVCQGQFVEHASTLIPNGSSSHWRFDQLAILRADFRKRLNEICKDATTSER